MNIDAVVEKEHLRKLPDFKVGDTVRVEFLIREAGKERVQAFQGIVIRKRGEGVSQTFTVRSIFQGEGVERIFPLHSPLIKKLTVVREGDVRRAKLYYLRGKVGKASRVKLKRTKKLKNEKKAG